MWFILKGDVFFLHLTQSLHSLLKTATQWEGERCNFWSKLGFHTRFCVNISAARSEDRDCAAVFISIITVNITIPASLRLFYLPWRLTKQLHSDVRGAFFRSGESGGMWIRQLCVRGDSFCVCVFQNNSFSFKHLRKFIKGEHREKYLFVFLVQ